MSYKVNQFQKQRTAKEMTFTELKLWDIYRNPNWDSQVLIVTKETSGQWMRKHNITTNLCSLSECLLCYVYSFQLQGCVYIICILPLNRSRFIHILNDLIELGNEFISWPSQPFGTLWGSSVLALPPALPQSSSLISAPQLVLDIWRRPPGL